MALPKSVIKIRSKKGQSYIEVTSNVDACQYSIIELTRAAMKDVSKFVVRSCNSQASRLKGLKSKGYGLHRRIRGTTSAFRYDVPFAKDGLPRADIGIIHDTWYGADQELGANGMPKLGILGNVVQSNIQTILKIEQQYLSAITDGESAIEGLIDETETIKGGADGE